MIGKAQILFLDLRRTILRIFLLKVEMISVKKLAQRLLYLLRLEVPLLIR